MINDAVDYFPVYVVFLVGVFEPVERLCLKFGTCAHIKNVVAGPEIRDRPAAFSACGSACDEGYTCHIDLLFRRDGPALLRRGALSLCSRTSAFGGIHCFRLCTEYLADNTNTHINYIHFFSKSQVIFYIYHQTSAGIKICTKRSCNICVFMI